MIVQTHRVAEKGPIQSARTQSPVIDVHKVQLNEIPLPLSMKQRGEGEVLSGAAFASRPAIINASTMVGEVISELRHLLLLQ